MDMKDWLLLGWVISGAILLILAYLLAGTLGWVYNKRKFLWAGLFVVGIFGVISVEVIMLQPRSYPPVMGSVSVREDSLKIDASINILDFVEIDLVEGGDTR